MAMSITYPEALPVSARRDDIMEAIRENQVVIVAGETGSGKTTQLPKMLLELGLADPITDKHRSYPASPAGRPHGGRTHRRGAAGQDR